MRIVGIGLLFLSVSCSLDEKSKTIQSEDFHLHNKKSKIRTAEQCILNRITNISFKHFDILIDSRYLRITTEFFNGRLLREDSLFVDNPVSRQTIYVYEHDTLVRSIAFPSRISTFIDTQGAKKYFLDNAIIDVYVLWKNDSLFYYFSGGGYCNRCSQMDFILSQDGRIKYLNYGIYAPYYNIVYNRIGSLSDVKKLLNLGADFENGTVMRELRIRSEPYHYGMRNFRCN